MKDPKHPNEDRFLENESWKEERRLEGESIDNDEIYNHESDEKYDSYRDTK